MKWNLYSRRLHRWGAVAFALPLLLVILSGLLLQLKKQIAWVQPPTMNGTSGAPQISLDQILDASRNVAEANIQTWSDIDRLDLRPNKGIVKVQSKNGFEIQLDLGDGRPLSVAYRRSDFIESLHDGSVFSDFAKVWVFFPNGLVLLGLWLTGAWLWWLPIRSRMRKRRSRSRFLQDETA